MPRTEQHERLQRAVVRSLPIRSDLTVLDAGCGSQGRLDLPHGAVVWGLDISSEQLDSRSDLAERLVGSVEDYPLPADTFDAIVSWNVLEHVDDPRRALDNFARALRPGGVIALAHPHPWGLKSVVAKLTPFWFHQWVLPSLGVKSCPFPTKMRWSLEPTRFVREAEARGLRVVHLEAYEALTQRRFREKVRLTGMPWAAIRIAWRVLSLGRADAARTEVMLLLRRDPVAKSHRQ